MRSIYAAQNRVEYIIDFLRERVDNETILYAKSRTRYKKLLEGLHEATELLCHVLGEDLLAYEPGPEEPEFSDPYVDPDLLNTVHDMQVALKKFEVFSAFPYMDKPDYKSKLNRTETLKELTTQGFKANHETVTHSYVSEPLKPPKQPPKPPKPSAKSSNEKMTKDRRIEILRKVESSIKEAKQECDAIADGTSDYIKKSDKLKNAHREKIHHPEYYKNLGDMLYNWYQIRVKNLDVNNTECRYNVKYLPVYASDIIMAYGEAVTQGSGSEARFRSTFNKWLREVESGNNKYMVPYDIFKIQKNREEHITPDGYRFLCTVFEGISYDIEDVWRRKEIEAHGFYEIMHLYCKDKSLDKSTNHVA